MPGPGLPSIQARLMSPLVILPSKHHRIFDPNEDLSDVPSHLLACRLKDICPCGGVPNIIYSAGLEHSVRSRKGGPEEAYKLSVIFCVIVDF